MDTFLNRVALNAISDAQMLDGLQHGCATTPVGSTVVVWSDAGILCLWPGQTDSTQACAEILHTFEAESTQSCPPADDAAAQAWLTRIFARPDTAKDQGDPIPVAVGGSDFDREVWQGLCQIPFGEIWTYGQLANFLGRPKAARAVGSALGRNQVSYLIPCHRVVRQSGEIGQFRWGSDIKQALIDWERGS